MVKDTNTRVMITLSRDTLEKLIKIVDEYDLSLSKYINMLIVDNLKERNMM